MTRRQKYFLKQKAIGLVLIVGTVIVALLVGGDITGALITIPVGLCLCFTKKMIWMDDYYWEVKEAKDKEL